MKKIYYYDASNPFSFESFGKELHKLLAQTKKSNQELVLLCIGTDRVTGDSLGPLVGHQLCSSYNNFNIYGTLEQPVHAINLKDTLCKIRKTYDNPYIIAIDASLGTKEHIGYVTLKQGPLKPGQGIAKDLPEIGDISITGIVNLSGQPGSFLLQNTRLHTVMTLVECITLGINLAETHLPILDDECDSLYEKQVN